MTMPSVVAAPLEWHPAYRDMTFLLDWLNDTKGAPIRLPVVKPLVAFMAAADEDLPVAEAAITYRTMTKHRAAGPAPWTGTPYIYTWWIGVDDLGRQIASDSKRRAKPEDELMYGPLRCDDALD